MAATTQVRLLVWTFDLAAWCVCRQVGMRLASRLRLFGSLRRSEVPSAGLKLLASLKASWCQPLPSFTDALEMH